MPNLSAESLGRVARLKRIVEERGGSARWLHLKLLRRPAYATVSRYLSGRTEAPPSFYDVAGKAVGVRPAWLLTGEGPITDEAAQQAEDQAIRRSLDQYDADVLAGLQFGTGAPRRARVKALLRFARKLDDAGLLSLNAPWRDLDARRELLEAAGRFLVATDEAFDAAGKQEAGPGTAVAGRLFRDELLHRVTASAADYVDWADAVLDLFSRRVVGLGARPHRVVERGTIQRQRRRTRPRRT